LLVPAASWGRRGGTTKRRRSHHQQASRRHRRHHATQPLGRAAWLGGVQITEYYPVPEAWFVGKRVSAPGLPGQYRIDWLYSSRGLAMEGDGIDLAGNRVHIDKLGDGGWINADGQPTSAAGTGSAGGSPVWRADGGYWLDASHQLTFPLDAGGWSAGRGIHYVAAHAISFAPGPSGPLRYYRSVAVDPHLIPLGSRIYIPAYRNIGGSQGWFVAQDTGGAITGRHLDVFRPPPASPSDGGQSFEGQRVYVVPPGSHPSGGPNPPPDQPSGGGGLPSSGGPAVTGPTGGASPTGGTSPSQ
jgi:3D (Asp-Asp-Asp) domain-containing protein